MTAVKNRLTRLAGRFIREENGAALIEFALILPFLVTLYLASIEFSKLDQFHSQVSKTASTVNDIVSKAPQMSAANVDSAMKAGETIAGNWSDRVRMEVRGLEITAAKQAIVRWSRAKNWTLDNAAKDSIVAVPDEITARPGFVVQTRVEFDYQWKATLLINKLPAHTIRYQFFNVPRASQQTTCPDCN